MFCEKCGSQIAPGERFCGNCGAPVAAQQPTVQQPYAPQPNMQQSPVQQQYQQPYRQQPNRLPYTQQPAVQQGYAPQFSGQPQPARESKKNKKAAIFAVIGAVIVAVGVFIGIGFATGWFGSSQTRAAKLEKKAVHKVLETVSDVVDLEAIQEGGTYSIEIKPGPALSSLLRNSGVDLSWLNSLKVDISGEDQDDFYAGSIGISLNNTEIATAKVMIDYAAGQIKFGVDGLSDSYAAIDMSRLTEMMEGMNLPINGLDSIIGMLEGAVDTDSGIPSLELLSSIDTEKVIDVLEKYIGKIIDALDTVETKSGSMTANGVTQQCDVHTTAVTMKQLIKVAQDLVDDLANDGAIKDILEELFPMIETMVGEEGDFNEFYTYYQESIKSMSSYLSMADSYIEEDIPVFTLVTYGSEDELIGLSFQLFSNGEPAFEASFGTATADGRFGTELTVNGQSYLLGSGTKNDSVVNGDVQLVIGGTPLVNVKLTDFNTDELSGTLEITMASEAFSMMNLDSSSASMLSAAAIRIELGGERTNVELLLGGQSVVQMIAEQTAKSPVAIDSSAAVVDAEQWIETVDLTTLIRRLSSAGLPAEYVQMLQASSYQY